MFNLDNISDMLNSTKSAADDVRHFRDGFQFWGSSQYYSDMSHANLLGRAADAISLITGLLWIAIIVVTIVLCVSGNDIILSYLSL